MAQTSAIFRLLPIVRKIASSWLTTINAPSNPFSTFSAAKAASATRANAADRQSVAALELAQDEIRSGRDDGPLVPMTRAA